ncbi:Phytanoyl-CoA dioxygenase [Niveomyces insectorum RCEF 264]|uniref:Phytanoyl-CoA dioxygenase n=1 Tax=Niveomyces insectorum RCEF 264 TaxID=1081102 RepID=A0A162J3U6_9HYPO|nr:Phytanoyl-CoA dioxygenase [Niveomyces insectorum RCEF 264]
MATETLTQSVAAALNLQGPDEVPDWLKEFRTRGWTVVRNAISKEKALAYADRGYDWLESWDLGFDRKDPKTYKAKYLPSHQRGGLYFLYGVGHEQFLWDLKSEPTLIEKFETIWGTNELLVSYDGVNLSVPDPELPKTDAAFTPWPHVDQAPLNTRFDCAQGILNMLPNGPEDGGLMVLDGSTKYYTELWEHFDHKKPAAGWNTWAQQLVDEEMVAWLESKGCKWVKVCAEPGDLLLWDSRTIHYGTPPRSTNPRFAAYVCYKPVTRVPDQTVLRSCFDEKVSSTHDPAAPRARPRLPAEDHPSYDAAVKRPVQQPPLSLRARAAAAAEGISSITVEQPPPAPPLPEPPLASSCSPPAPASQEPTPVARNETQLLRAAYNETIIKPELIERLVHSFYYASYPTRPYFHWPTYQAQIKNQIYRSDWGIFVVTMAVCAMSAYRLSSGLTMPPDPPLNHADASAIAARCYAAAVKALPADVTAVADYFQMMKASAILASISLQNSDLKRTLAHLGDYGTLSILHGFYNEANWPSNLNEIQRQERRRLFWSVYQQEQYMSSDFGIVSRQREAQATVRYPAEVFCDEDITETAVHLRPDRVSFLQGCNFCTNLYRLFENIKSAARARPGVARDDPESAIHGFLARLAPPRSFTPDSLQFVATLYADLPPELTQVKAITEDPQSARFAFIACNILITTQMLKLLLLGTGESSVHQCCAIASELLDELSSVPLAFFHATNMSSLRHLAHVGHMLASVIQGPLSAWTYLQVRGILRVLADFLERIEAARSLPAHLSLKLRTQIDRIDQCMRKTGRQQPDPGLRSVGQTLLQCWQNPSTSSPSSNTLQQFSPPPSVVSGTQPLPEIVNPPAFERTQAQPPQQEREQQQRSYMPVAQRNEARNNADVGQQPSEFRDPAFDFIPQPDNTAFALDPLENWPLSLGEPDTFDELAAYPALHTT